MQMTMMTKHTQTHTPSPPSPPNSQHAHTRTTLHLTRTHTHSLTQVQGARQGAQAALDGRDARAADEQVPRRALGEFSAFVRCFSCLGGGGSCFLVAVLWAESLKQKDTLMARNHKNNQPDDRGRRVAAARRQLRVGARQPGVSRTVEQSASGGVRVSCTALAATPHTAPPASIIPSVSTPRRLFSEIMIACITLGIVTYLAPP